MLLVRDASCCEYAEREVGHAERHEHHAEATRVLALGIVFDESPGGEAEQDHAPGDACGGTELRLPDRLLRRPLQELVQELGVVGERITAKGIGFLRDHLGSRWGFVFGYLRSVPGCFLGACQGCGRNGPEQGEYQKPGGSQSHVPQRWIVGSICCGQSGLVATL